MGTSMQKQTCALQKLDQKRVLPHSNNICGQSRSGGFRTSNSRRRSNIIFGRVAVTHVQGSPKGGGALGLLRVLNTRLSLVPPFKMKEGLMHRAAKAMFLYLLSAATIVGPVSAQTQSQIERRYTPALKRCIDNSGYGDAAMTECYDIELSVQDGRLNQAYKMVMLRLSAARKTALKNEERAWVKRRDAVCQRHAAPEAGGTMYDVMLSSCLVDETISRTIFLENYKG